MASSSSSSTTTTDVLEGLEYTTTLVVAVVCTVIVVISLFVERFLHYLGKVMLKVASFIYLYHCIAFSFTSITK